MSDPNVVWENTIDRGTWGCKVVRTGERQGRLTVWSTSTGVTILDEPVGLAYDAVFGPDVDDLAMWQGAVLGAIDNYNDTNDGATQ